MPWEGWAVERRVLIWEVRVERVARASWMQESRLERRIRASKEEVGRVCVVGVLGGRVAD